MSVPLTVNGSTFNYPEVDDVDWGVDATDWAAAVTVGMLQKAGGLFQLLAEVDFGTSYGVKSLYLKTRTSNPAATGLVRMANTDFIAWRNGANSADLTLSVTPGNILQFNGSDVQGAITVSDTATIDLDLTMNVLTAAIKTGSIDNSMVSNSAAIAFSKLAGLPSGNIIVGSGGGVPASVAMSGDATLASTGALTIAANAVTNAKLAQMAQSTIKGRAASSGTGDPVDLTATQATAILNAMVGDSGSGGTKGLVPAPISGDATKFLKGDGTWAVPAGAGDVVGPGSSTDSGFARFDGLTGKLLKNSPATITNADVIAAAAIAVNKLAALTVSRAVVTDGSGFLAAATTTATEIGYVNGVTSAIQTQLNTKVTNPMSAGGDMIYGGASGVPTRLPNGSAAQFLQSAGGTSAPAWASFIAPTQTTLTSTGTTTGWLFVVSSANATAGATYTNNGNTYTVLSTIAAATLLWCSQASAPAASGTLTKSAGTGDATITFSTRVALATYTVPTSPRSPIWLRVRMAGAGGGGAGGGTSGTPGTGGVGNGSYFGADLLLCTGGSAGTAAANNPATGGIATLKSPAYGLALAGNDGEVTAQNVANGATFMNGRAGAPSPLFGGSGGGYYATTTAGTAGKTNTGAGGAGGATNSSTATQIYGEAGASGACIDAIIASPSATYVYIVGTGGVGGTAGTNGGVGGAGAAGVIYIEEHYQ